METAPDICSKHIQYKMKTAKADEFDLNVERDNAVYFSACSRAILDLLCCITENPIWNDEKWKVLQESLIRAQAVEKDLEKYLNKSFGEEFPEITYSYHKNSEFALSLNVIAEESNSCLQQMSDYEAAEAEQQKKSISSEELADAFSPEGNLARSGCTVYLENAKEQFFDYNEIAYRRVQKVTGEHAAMERVTGLQTFCSVMENQPILL